MSKQFFNIIILLFCFISAKAQLWEYTTSNALDSLKKNNHSDLISSKRETALLKICYAYFNYKREKTKYDSLTYYYSLLNSKYASTLLKGDSNLLYSKIVYRKTKSIDTVILYVNKAINYFKAEGVTDDRIAFAYQYLAKSKKQLSYGFDSKQPNGIVENLIKAIIFFEKSGNKRRVISCYVDLHLLYQSVSNTYYADLYLNKAIFLNRTVNDPYFKAYLTYTKAVNRAEEILGENTDIIKTDELKLSDKDYKAIGLSIAELKSSLPMWLAVDEKNDGYHLSLNQLAYFYTYIQNKDSALKYAFKTFKENKALDEDQIAANYGTIGDVYHAFKNYEVALKYMDTCMVLSKEIGEFYYIRDLYANFAKIYSKKSDYKTAYQYQTLYNALNDSLYTDEARQSLNELEVKYETEKNKNQIAKLNVDVDLKEYQNKKQQYIIYTFLIFIVLIAFMALFIIKYVKTKRSIELETSIREAEDKERERLAKDLHDDLGGTLSALKINLTLKSSDSGTLEILEKAINDLRSISHKLMPVNFDELGLNKSLDHFIKLIDTSTTRFSYKSHGDDSMLHRVKQLLIYRIILELSTNVIKHSKAKQCIIQAILFEDFIRYSVEDDGIGFSYQNAKNGIGLKNIRNRISKLKGTLHVDSNKNGTTVFFEIPIK